MSECTYTKPITSYIMNKQNSLVNGWGHKKSLLPFLTLILFYETIYIFYEAIMVIKSNAVLECIQ